MLRQAGPAGERGAAGGAQAEAEAWRLEAVRHGALASRAAGVGWVGDIAGSVAAAAARGEAGVAGVTFLELFGVSRPFDEAGIASVAGLPAGMGVQPHAPYSAGPRLYDAASRSGRRCSTHLAEWPAEAVFVAEGEGPMRAFLHRLGKWNEAAGAAYGGGLSPVQWMRPYLERAPWLVAHVNRATDDDIALLAQTRASVAYCPVAGDYFGHPLEGERPHRYREMMGAGVNVCLGTDSLVCQPGEEPQPLGMLGPMRRLYRRDAVSPGTLLAMATTHGHKALGQPEAWGTLEPGAPSRFCVVPLGKAATDDTLRDVLQGHALSHGLHLSGPFSARDV